MNPHTIVNLDLPKGRAIYPKYNQEVNRDCRLADFSVNIERVVTDVDTNIIDKSLLPLNLQVGYNYALFYEFDRQNAYRLSQQKVPLEGASQYVGVFVQGTNDPFYLFNGFGDIRSKLSLGDIYLLYTDDILNPNFFIWVIISNPYAGMGGITANTGFYDGSKTVNVKWFKMAADNSIQYAAPLFFMASDAIGSNKNNSINPFASLSTDDKLDNFIKIDFPFSLTQYFGIASQMRFESNLLNYVFKLTY